MSLLAGRLPAADAPDALLEPVAEPLAADAVAAAGVAAADGGRGRGRGQGGVAGAALSAGGLHLVLAVRSFLVAEEASALLGVLFVGVRRLAFALEVAGEILLEIWLALTTCAACTCGFTYHAIPALIGAASSVRLTHEVGTLFVLHDVAAHVESACGNGGGTLKRHALLERVLDVLGGRGPDGLEIGLAHGGDGRELVIQVARDQSGVVGPAMVVGTAGANAVKGIDDVCLGDVAAVGGA